MSEETKRIIEIEGVKIEVDLRTARRIEELKIGSRVRVLTKDYGGHKVSTGVIIGFEQFKKLPTLIVATVNPNSYSTDNPMQIVHYNADSKDTEIVGAADDDFEFDGDLVERQFDRLERKHEAELQKARDQRAWFRQHFGQIAKNIEPVEAE
ncbi:MAG: hypothetical protein VX529_10410 [Pseudomonadota bacterium]|nr:hypothetical protein [Pseudomonadota bacterium]